MKHARDAKTGFTLVELLVVIGIIAVLISVLLPALSKARASAQTTQCMSMMRQVGMAYRMYANDNKGRILGWFAWPALLPKYMGYRGPDLTEFAYSNALFTSQEYIQWAKANRPMTCPTFATDLQTTGTRDDGRTVAVNRHIRWPDKTGLIGSLNETRDSTATMLAACSGAYNPTVAGNPSNQVTNHVDWSFGTGGYPPRFPHYGRNYNQVSTNGGVFSDGRTNFTFFDGHVETRRVAEAYLYVNYASSSSPRGPGRVFWRGKY